MEVMPPDFCLGLAFVILDPIVAVQPCPCFIELVGGEVAHPRGIAEDFLIRMGD